MKQTKQLLIIIKSTLLVFLLSFNIPMVSSQSFVPIKAPSPAGFIGLGFGVNNYGLGIGSEMKVQDVLWVYGNAGISTWGYRLTGGVTFYPGSNGYKSSFSLGYSYASGIKNFEPSLEVEDDSYNRYSYGNYSHYTDERVLLDLHPVTTLNLIYAYNLKVGRKSKFVFSGGYSVILTEELFENRTFHTLSNRAKNFIDIMAPGGLIVGVKFMIGV